MPTQGTIYQGTAHTIGFVFTGQNITGWQFQASFKESRNDTTALVTLSTGNGGFVVTDGAAGRVEMRLTPTQTELLPVGRVVYDVLRTDLANGPVYYFGGDLKVKQAVTVREPGVAVPPAPDVTPSAFSFTDATDVALSTLTESDAITLAGIDAVVALTITGGEYQINGGAWASIATTASVGDSIKVRGTSSGSYSTSVSVVLTIGGVSDTFTITTVAAPGELSAVTHLGVIVTHLGVTVTA
jgi:hypothetical protein